jgi:beta-glucanase (GH16 family)
MRKISLFLSLSFLLSCGALIPVAAAQQPAVSGDGWKLVFSDDFTGSVIDSSKWNAYADCWGGGNQERQCYTARPENVTVHDGQLELTARFEKATGPSLPSEMRTAIATAPDVSKPFTSGKISTKGKFSLTYGRMEVRARSPLGQGVWPAIWLLPEQNLYGDWPGSGEIDVMESVNMGVRCGSCFGGIENNIYGTIHYGSNMHHQWQQKGFQLPKGTEGDWHIYRVDWAPNDIAWFVDGKKFYHTKLSNWRDPLQKGPRPAANIRNAPFDRPFYLILNLAIGGLWPESHDQGGVALQDFPKIFAVDWVHAYQCAGEIDASGTCVPH